MENKFKVGDVVKGSNYFHRGVVVVECPDPSTIQIVDFYPESMGWDIRGVELVTDGIECLRAYTKTLAMFASAHAGDRRVIDIIEERANAILDELAQ